MTWHPTDEYPNGRGWGLDEWGQFPWGNSPEPYVPLVLPTEVEFIDYGSGADASRRGLRDQVLRRRARSGGRIPTPALVVRDGSFSFDESFGGEYE